MANDERATGTHDATYDIVSVLYHALQGAELYEEYAGDAEEAGDQELARFFQDIQAEEKRRADRAKVLLATRLKA